MGKYDNGFGWNNTYGRALTLLVDHQRVTPPGDATAIHLDLGCGYGHIAEELVRATGLQYVGVDPDPEAMKSLRERGFEAHEAGLGEHDNTLAQLRAITAGRLHAPQSRAPAATSSPRDLGRRRRTAARWPGQAPRRCDRSRTRD